MSGCVDALLRGGRTHKNPAKPVSIGGGVTPINRASRAPEIPARSVLVTGRVAPSLWRASMSSDVDPVHPASLAPDISVGLVSVSFGVDPVLRASRRHNDRPGRSVCVVTSNRSFGQVENPARTISVTSRLAAVLRTRLTPENQARSGRFRSAVATMPSQKKPNA